MVCHRHWEVVAGACKTSDVNPEVEHQIEADWMLVHTIEGADADLNVAQEDFLSRAVHVLSRDRPLSIDLRHELQLVAMALPGLTAYD